MLSRLYIIAVIAIDLHRESNSNTFMLHYTNLSWILIYLIINIHVCEFESL